MTIILIVILFFITLTGSTISGAVAVSRIRRSHGQLTGLPFAAFGMLFYPLLALGAGTYALLHLAYRAITAKWLWIPATQEHPPSYAYFHFYDAFQVFGAVAALLVCFFAARAAWRAISGYQKTSVPSVGAPAAWLFVAGIANLAMLVGIMAAWLPEASWSQHPFICTLISAIFLLYAVITALVFRGALKMLNREDYAASRIGAICSTLSFNIVSLPVGIWALVRLSKPEVKALFQKK